MQSTQQHWPGGLKSPCDFKAGKIQKALPNRATVPQKWPPPPRNVTDSCEQTESRPATPDGELFSCAAVQLMRHIEDSQGQILALTFRLKPLFLKKLPPLRWEAAHRSF